MVTSQSSKPVLEVLNDRYISSYGILSVKDTILIFSECAVQYVGGLGRIVVRVVVHGVQHSRHGKEEHG